MERLDPEFFLPNVVFPFLLRLSSSELVEIMSLSKECWICYQTERETVGEVWVHPCICRGGLKWCHEKCLLGWIDEKQKGNSSKVVKCPQCLTPYTIMYPPSGILPAPSSPLCLAG